MRPLLRATAPDGAPLRRCAACDALRPASAFYASCERYRVHRCKACSARRQAAYMARRRASPHFRMLRTLRRHEGASDGAWRFVEADVARVLAAFGAASALSRRAPRRLVLARWRADRPLCPANAVPLTVREAAAHRADGAPVEARYAPDAVARADALLRGLEAG